MNDSYTTCWTLDEWVRVLREAQYSPYVGYDFETAPDRRLIDFAPKKINKKVNKSYPTALRPDFGAKICGIAVGWLDESTNSIKSAYIGVRHYHKFAGGKQPNPEQVTRAFSDFIDGREASKLLVVHNLAMELQFQASENIKWPKRGQLHDTQIAARVLNKGVGWKEMIGLKPLQREVLGRNQDSKNDLDRWLKAHGYKSGADIWRAPVALAGWYAQDDARDCLEIFLRWKKLIVQPPTNWWWSRGPDRRHRLDLYELEIETAINATMSGMRGTRFSRPLARKQSKAARLLQNVATRWIRHYLEMPTLNPGSQMQLRGIFFRGRNFGFEPSLAHTTETFKKMREADQVRVIAGLGDKHIIDFMSLDVEALGFYAKTYPQHAELMFMLAVYRKCNTAISWFDERVLQFGVFACPDPWLSDEGKLDWMELMFHRLRTVGTTSGRMSSADYNAQQVPKRFKMLMNAGKLFGILEKFLPPNQFRQLMETLLVTGCRKGDEEKVLGLNAEDPVVDFSVRSLFIARPGYNMRLHDLSQVEIRGFAHYTGNQLLCGGYGTPMKDEQVNSELEYIQAIMAGERPNTSNYNVDWMRHVQMEANPFDAHQFVADEIGIPRKGAKGINFGIIYGMGKKKLARNMGWSVAEGRRYIRDYNSRLPEIESVQAKIKVALRSRGYVFDPFGRRYYLPMNKAYVGLNRLIQGWAASAFKVGFVRTCEMFSSEGFGATAVHPVLGRRIPDGARVLTCIHDELMNEISTEYDTPHTDWAIRSCMTAFHGLKVPLASSSESSAPGTSGSWDEVFDVEAEDIRSEA